jgi:hypothetical protein
VYWSVQDSEYGAPAAEDRVVIAFPRRPASGGDGDAGAAEGSARRLTRPALLHAGLLTTTIAATIALIALLVVLAAG